MAVARGWWEGGRGSYLLGRGSAGDDENILEMNGGDGYTTM